jgi:hypothetical protein
MGDLFFLLVVWIPIAVVSAKIASNRGGSDYSWFRWGFLFGPFALILAFVLPGEPCSACKKKIHPKATKCPYCQTVVHIKLEKKQETVKTADNLEMEMKIMVKPKILKDGNHCLNCGEIKEHLMNFCSNCGQKY